MTRGSEEGVCDWPRPAHTKPFYGPQHSRRHVLVTISVVCLGVYVVFRMYALNGSADRYVVWCRMSLYMKSKRFTSYDTRSHLDLRCRYCIFHGFIGILSSSRRWPRERPRHFLSVGGPEILRLKHFVSSTKGPQSMRSRREFV